jgi:hypothetical protein
LYFTLLLHTHRGCPNSSSKIEVIAPKEKEEEEEEEEEKKK